MRIFQQVSNGNPSLPSPSSSPNPQRTAAHKLKQPSHIETSQITDGSSRVMQEKGRTSWYRPAGSNMGANTSPLEGGASHSSPPKNSRMPPSTNPVNTQEPIPRAIGSPTDLNDADMTPQQPQPPPQAPRKSMSVRLVPNATPPRRGPLIFAAMGSVEQGAEEPISTQPQQFTRNIEPWESPSSSARAYPSPPTEYGTPPSRVNTLPPQHLNGNGQFSPRAMMEDTMPGPPSAPTSPSPAVTPDPPAVPEQPYHPVQPRTPPRQPAPTLSSPPLDPYKEFTGHPHHAGKPAAQPQPQARLQTRKSAKAAIAAHPSAPSSATAQSNGHTPSSSSDSHPHVHRTLTKARPITPVTPPARKAALLVEVDEDVRRNAGIPLDDDPFAKVEGVRLLKPSSRDGNPTKKLRAKDATGKAPPSRDGSGSEAPEKQPVEEKHEVIETPEVAEPPDVAEPQEVTETQEGPENQDSAEEEDDDDESHYEDDEPPSPTATPAMDIPISPKSPDAYRRARSRRRGAGLGKAPPSFVAGVEVRKDRTPIPFPLEIYLADPNLLSSVVVYLSFYDWCQLSSVSKYIRTMLVENIELREVVLERYLQTVGYTRWATYEKDPLPLSLQNLHDYMRGVSTPTHEYARVAGLYLQSWTHRDADGNEELLDTVRDLTNSTRAYTRVVLRLRVQAEAEAAVQAAKAPRPPPPSMNGFAPPSRAGTSFSRVSSRAPSPTMSTFSHSHHSHTQSAGRNHPMPARPPTPTNSSFRSPLFRMRRAPLLRVFVPSPDEWLSDSNVVECETELERAGVRSLLRMGDVVWDVAVGDEGNVGRLVWDGSYLIDLDYSYSPVGDLPKYMHTLAFPPSYFHRVIRTASTATNPIAHIDVSPWGEEIATNLQLLQDRVRTETPQGAYHNVVRWVNRSTFTIRPPLKTPPRQNNGRSHYQPPRIPIPDTDNLFVDPGWYGTIVVETEGTNESLADLQDRCGPGAFPPRANAKLPTAKDRENRKVFRILRERSRPGEIWIKTVSAKERLV